MRSVDRCQYADYYDYVFIGSSTISLFEAVYRQRRGHTILVIDDQPCVGGVWVSLELFGLHDVENAIHYFLYSRRGIEFMRSVLGWSVIPSKKKYRIFSSPVLGMRRWPYDSRLSLIAARVDEARRRTARPQAHDASKLGVLLRACKEALERQPRSYYFAGGTPEMMRHVQAMLRNADLNLMLNTYVERIHFDKAARRVFLGTSRGEVKAGCVFITHGARLTELSSDSGPIRLDREVHRRPQIHLLIRDASPSDVYEGIFVADPLIKYVHDVTRFTREADQLKGIRKLFVIALQHDCKRTEDLFGQVLEKLIAAHLVGADAALEGTHWYESFLPELSTATLEEMKARLAPLIDILKTEDFCGAMGLYGERWRTALH